nr:MFS transporter [Rhodomicrobium lacus]
MVAYVVPADEVGKVPLTAQHRKVIVASSLGTVFEFYDFFIYGTLAAFFGALFFPPGNETAAFLASLATFGAGFAVRPFGALIFGRLGDLAGRKYTFLATIVIMGISTAVIGLLPTYAQIGMWAPVILVAMRLLQGLAIGGEYGGAATYLAEHSPPGRRGARTSWLQTTSTVGLILSLVVIFACRASMSPADFAAWGWRLPFIGSIVLLATSVWIRLSLEESPVFAQMKRDGKQSQAPIKESFGNWTNLRRVLVALFGAIAGQAVVWYTAQFYVLFFMTATLKLDYSDAYLLIGIALVLATPMYLFFGSLSDKVGRKPVILSGLLLAAIGFFPAFHALTDAVNPRLAAAQRLNPVVLYASECNVHIFSKPVSQCDLAKEFLAKAGVTYEVRTPSTDQALSVSIGTATIRGFDSKAWAIALEQASYPKAAEASEIRWMMAVAIILAMMVAVTAVYGPMAAFLVELFPARIRYTSLSLPFHLGNGIFGGFLPFVSFAIVTATGNPYAGLWYPVGVAAISFVVGLFFLRDHEIND